MKLFQITLRTLYLLMAIIVIVVAVKVDYTVIPGHQTSIILSLIIILVNGPYVVTKKELQKLSKASIVIINSAHFLLSFLMVTFLNILSLMNGLVVFPLVFWLTLTSIGVYCLLFVIIYWPMSDPSSYWYRAFNKPSED